MPVVMPGKRKREDGREGVISSQLCQPEVIWGAASLASQLPAPQAAEKPPGLLTAGPTQGEGLCTVLAEALSFPRASAILPDPIGSATSGLKIKGTQESVCLQTTGLGNSRLEPSFYVSCGPCSVESNRDAQ